MSLSDRVRPNIEAAPWVIEEVKELEKAYQEQEEELDATMMAFNFLKKENDHLKHIIRSYKNFMTEIAIQADAALFMSKEMDKE